MSIPDSLKYAIREISTHWSDQTWWRERILTRVNAPVQQRLAGYGGLNIMEQDWDTLIVLDACRADLFEEVLGIERWDAYRRVTSRGSATHEWVRRNFSGNTFGDTVYVTGNPLVSQHAPNAWHALIQTWKTDFKQNTSTILPEAVTEDALIAYKEYPKKRLIVHYMQPHYPFLWDGEGPQYAAIGSETSNGIADPSPAKNIWDAISHEYVDHDTVWTGYQDTLNAALPYVHQLINEIDGKTIVTADHGNELGRISWPVPTRVYGHPPGLRHPGLISVPWAEVESASRRSIRDDGVESATDKTSVDDVDLESKLEALGYV